MPDRLPNRPPDPLPELFADALEMDAHARMGLLAQLCETDPETARRLEALLEASSAPSPVDTPAQITDERQWSPMFPKQSLEGARIGGMEVTRTLGSGSMGTVFEAQQLQPPRRVALKVLRPEAADSASRLMLEAEALSRLNHPSIAKVFGAGTEAVNGRPTVWMAFEFVPEAKTLTEYAHDSGLGTPERVRLMVEVCRAIEHAHSKGVLHRDLKPANLLVSGHSEHAVKVIDFGLARVSDPLDGEARERTRHGELLGTLLYMSPEQCAGDPASIDVRTDVYGLGVVLFELLTGSLPFESKGQSILQMLDTVRSGKRRTLRELSPAMDEDLEAVTSQACASAQEERYAAAGALADDLERWLQGEPVRARRASLLHRLRLFARRRRGAFVVSAAAALMLLAAATIISTLVLGNLSKLREIERRDLAVAAARGELTSVTEILEGITARDPEARSMQASLEAKRVGSPEEKRAVVERAVGDLERLQEELKEDSSSWIQLARAYEQVGELHGTAWNAGALDAEGRHVANLHALELWRRVMGSGRGTEADRDALFRTLVRLANSSRAQGNLDYGKGVADEAVGMARQALSGKPAGSDRLFDLIDALGARADLSILDENPRRGLLDAQECVQQLAAFVPSVPADVLRKLDYESWNGLRLGFWLKRSGSPEEGAAAVRKARERRVEVIFTSASLPEVQAANDPPSRHIRLAWQVFGRLELVAYRDLGDEDGAAGTLLGLAESAARLGELPVESYAMLLPQITAFAALLADGELSQGSREAVAGVERLWGALARGERARMAAGLPDAVARLSNPVEGAPGGSVAFGEGARRYLAELRARHGESGD